MKISLRQPTFDDATRDLFPWEMMMHPNPDLGSASDWLKQISHAARQFRSTS